MLKKEIAILKDDMESKFIFCFIGQSIYVRSHDDAWGPHGCFENWEDVADFRERDKAERMIEAYFKNAKPQNVASPKKLHYFNNGGPNGYAIEEDGIWYIKYLRKRGGHQYTYEYYDLNDLNSEVVEAIKLLQAWSESNA